MLPGRRTTKLRLTWFSAVVMTCSLTTGGLIANSGFSRAQTAAPGQAPPAKAAPAAPAPGYVGSDTCLTCHSDMEATLKGTQHAQAHNPRTPSAQRGCESCHGPGQAHVD